MTIQEALIISNHGWQKEDMLSQALWKKSIDVLSKERQRIYLEAEKDKLERELNEVQKKINDHIIPF
jgi:hypothetical protein